MRDPSNLNLTGSIPSSYTSLSNLQSFSLANNSPIDEIPVGFATSAGPEAFSISENGLNGTIPTDLGAFSKLSSVSLSNNHLSGQILVLIGNDSNLVVPLLRNNQFNGSIPIDSPLWIRRVKCFSLLGNYFGHVRNEDGILEMGQTCWGIAMEF
jgi:hypothetical protein